MKYIAVDWAAFVNADKDEALANALAAKEEWEKKGYSGKGYRVLVGTLTEEAKLPVREYQLTPLPGPSSRKFKTRRRKR